MQTIGPYRLVRALGQCPVGGVWSGVDGANNGVTVALLSSAAAHDPGWRNAFAATANSLAQSGEVPLIGGDYSGPTPWIASSARDGAVLGRVFVALGMDYQPATASGEGGEPAPAEGQTVLATGSAQVAAEPVAGSADPVAGADATAPAQGSASPYSYDPQPASPHTVSPFSVPPGPPPRRSRGLLIGLTVLVVALLVGGGSVVAVAVWPEGSEPEAAESTDPASQEPTPPVATQPGLEPPADGEWPADWPVFTEEDDVTEVSGVIGEFNGQAFQIPAEWDCVSVASQGDFAQYTCGPGGDASEIGGELRIRTCPDPCDPERRAQMRTRVEAWGLQWIEDSIYRSWAETNEIDGEPRYGFVYAAYYRTTGEGRIDRELMLRLTAPIDQADEIRKVANSVREAMI